MTAYEKTKLWRKNNPERVAEQSRRYQKKHPETHIKARAKYRLIHRERLLKHEAVQAAQRRKKDPAGNRRRSLAFRERREMLMVATAGRPRPNVCDLCAEFHRQIVFDHCHLTHTFRGWLCDRCNKVLGLMSDSPNLLRLLAKYVEDHNGKADNGTAKEAPDFVIRGTKSKLSGRR